MGPNGSSGAYTFRNILGQDLTIAALAASTGMSFIINGNTLYLAATGGTTYTSGENTFVNGTVIDSLPRTTISNSTLTLLASSNTVQNANLTAGNVTYILPIASTCNNKVFIFSAAFNGGYATGAIQTQGSDQIVLGSDGSLTSINLTIGGFVIIQSDGSNWYVVTSLILGPNFTNSSGNDRLDPFFYDTTSTPETLYFTANTVHYVDTSSGDVTITLQDPFSMDQKIQIFKKIASANSLIISPNGFTIDGSSNLILNAQNQTAILQANGGNWSLLALYVPGATGTLTSVGLSPPSSIISVSGSPITSSGTLTETLVSQPASTFWGSPSNNSGTPWFRNIVGSDLGLALQAGANTTLSLSGSSLIISSTASGGGGGSVTQVTSGNLANFASVTVNTNTTTPAFVFGMTQAESGQFFGGNPSGGLAAPNYRNLVLTDLPLNTFTYSTSSLLNALASSTFGQTGLVTQVSDTSFVDRTITGTAGNIVVTNGSGTGGNPNVNIGASVFNYSNTSGIFNALSSGTAAQDRTQLGTPSAADAFLTLGAVPAELTNGRQIAAGAGIQIVDGGAGSTLTISNLASGFTTLNNNQVWIGNGSNIAVGVTLSGDVTSSNTGVMTIGANVVSSAKFRQSAAISVVGNSTNAMANVADITAPAGGQILASNASGTSLSFTATPQLGVPGVTAGLLTMAGSTSGSVAVGVPAVAGTTTWNFPGNNGTPGQVTTTDGSGNASWGNYGVFPPISAATVRSPAWTGINNLNATTFNGVGMTALGISGTGATASNALGSDGNWILLTSSATAGQACYFSGSAQLSWEQLPRFVTMVKTGPSSTDIQNCRIWVGFAGSAIGTDTSVTKHVMFRYCPGTDGTAFWRLSTADGTTEHVIVSTIPIASNTVYTLAADFSSGTSVLFYINGVLAGTSSSNLPALTSAGMNPYGIVLTPTTTTQINFKVKNWFQDST